MLTYEKKESPENVKYSAFSSRIHSNASKNPLEVVHACVGFLLNHESLKNDSFEPHELFPAKQVSKLVIRELYFSLISYIQESGKGHTDVIELDISHEAGDAFWADFFQRDNLGPHIGSALLWYHLRYMTEPVFTFDIYDEIIEIVHAKKHQINGYQDNLKLGNVDVEEKYLSNYEDVGYLSTEGLKYIIKQLSISRRRTFLLILRLARKWIEVGAEMSNPYRHIDEGMVIFEEDDESEYKRLQLQFGFLDTSIAVDIVNFLSPLLFRPKTGAYMSLVHKQNLVCTQMLLLQFIYHYETLSEELNSISPPVERLPKRIVSDSLSSFGSEKKPEKVIIKNIVTDVDNVRSTSQNVNKSVLELNITHAHEVEMMSEGTVQTDNSKDSQKVLSLESEPNVNTSVGSLNNLTRLIQKTVKESLYTTSWIDNMLSGFIILDELGESENDENEENKIELFDGSKYINMNVRNESIKSDDKNIGNRIEMCLSIPSDNDEDTDREEDDSEQNPEEKEGKEGKEADIGREETLLSKPLFEEQDVMDISDEEGNGASGPASPETPDVVVADVTTISIDERDTADKSNISRTSYEYRNEELNLNKKSKKASGQRSGFPVRIGSSVSRPNSASNTYKEKLFLNKSGSEGNLNIKSNQFRAGNTSYNSSYLLESRIEKALGESNSSYIKAKTSLDSSSSSPQQNSGDVDRDSVYFPSGSNNIESKSGQFTSKQKLEMEKKRLKKRLKMFDLEFERKHGRRPQRSEKEPIRHLYEAYNGIKILLSKYPQVQNAKSSKSSVALTSQNFRNDIKNMRPQDVQMLIHEKKALQGKLRKFEKMFEEANSRKVKFNRDIKGLESDYRRYKDLKQTLSLLRDK